MGNGEHLPWYRSLLVSSYSVLFPDTLRLGYKEHAVNTEKYVYCRKVQKAMRFMIGIGN